MVQWVDDERFEVDGVGFALTVGGGSSAATQFAVNKEPDLIRSYLDVLPEFEGGNILELGIAEGGSAALMSLVAKPAHLTAVDLASNRVAALDELIAARSLADTVHAHYGVDQSDRSTLRSIIEEDFGGELLDLVIDDASHQAGPTRASFDIVFPLVRPGGLYIIEDWNWEHRWGDRVDGFDSPSDQADATIEAMMVAHMGKLIAAEPDHASRLLGLALEILLARASMSDVLGEVLVNPFWVAVRRGPGPVDRDTFRLDDLVRDHFGLVPAAPQAETKP